MQAAQQGRRAGTVADRASGHEEADRAAVLIADSIQFSVQAALCAPEQPSAPSLLNHQARCSPVCRDDHYYLSFLRLCHQFGHDGGQHAHMATPLAAAEVAFDGHSQQAHASTPTHCAVYKLS